MSEPVIRARDPRTMALMLVSGVMFPVARPPEAVRTAAQGAL
ncbi:hypothetical protein [Actinomadura bangladeshensis]|nr:hypothetical protein [Actinomadura bangladeshensis]